MRRCALTPGFAMFALGVVIVGPAFAADDTWVSVMGTNAGACTIAAPCRSLNFALAHTSPGGSIVVLSSGVYGPLNVTKSVNVMAEGVQATVTGEAGCGASVCINTGIGDTVSLHGLTIQPDNFPSGHAIVVSGGGMLSLERCVIRGNTSFGIVYASTVDATLRVFDTTIRSMGHAVDLVPLQGSVQRVLIDGVRINDTLHGVVLEGQGAGAIRATVRNTLIDGVPGSSVLADSGSVSTRLMLDRTVITTTAIGIDVRSGQDLIVRMGDSIISGQRISGVIPVVSYGTNKAPDSFDGAPDGIPIPTIPLK